MKIAEKMDRDRIMLFCVGLSISSTVLAVLIYHSALFPGFLCFLALSVGALFLTLNLIPVVREMALKAEIFGMDINKRGTEGGTHKIPEALGIVPGTVFLMASIVGLVYSKSMGNDFMVAHITSILCVSLMIFLGFGDDVFDLRWRHKLWLPTIASLPLLMVYQGSTAVSLPWICYSLLGISKIELSYAFLIYIAMVAIFCTNSINIFAGINGLEVGQSIVIGCTVLLFNAVVTPPRLTHLIFFYRNWSSLRRMSKTSC